MTKEKESFVKAGKKSRNHLNLPIMSFIVADDWIDKVGYKIFHYWLKFHTWVDRTDAAHVENVIPYSFEKVYEKLGISKATFFRDIPVLWEFGLIDIVEYEHGKQKGTNPRNIIVYEYPFNDITKKYEPLEKLRDWKKDYQSQSKINGQKGAVIQKANKISTKNGGGLKNETVENNVDNLSIGGLTDETRGGLKNETRGVSKMRANNYSNIFNNLTNNINNDSNNNSLSIHELQLIDEILVTNNFTETEREKIINHIHEKDLLISLQAIKEQCKFMLGKNDIMHRAKYFINGIENNEGRQFPRPKQPKQDSEYTRKVPFYNWLEVDGSNVDEEEKGYGGL